MGPLLVRQARWIAHDVVELRLTRPDGGTLPPWEPGAHIELTLPSGLRRPYSLCGDPADTDAWTIAVHRVPDGRGGSREIHETALVGRELEVTGPVNRFPCSPPRATSCWPAASASPHCSRWPAN